MKLRHCMPVLLGIYLGMNSFGQVGTTGTIQGGNSSVCDGVKCKKNL